MSTDLDQETYNITVMLHVYSKLTCMISIYFKGGTLFHSKGGYFSRNKVKFNYFDIDSQFHIDTCDSYKHKS